MTGTGKIKPTKTGKLKPTLTLNLRRPFRAADWRGVCVKRASRAANSVTKGKSG